MDSCSLQATTATTLGAIHKSLPKTNLRQISCLQGQALRFPNFNRYPQSRKFRILDIKSKASGTETIGSQSSKTNQTEDRRKDENLAFVAGATGRVGSRTVRELIKLGFRVRAGLRSSRSLKAQSLVESVKQLKFNAPEDALELVECDLEKMEQIEPAIGNASVVLCCIGASEKEVFDVTGPCRIDYRATKYLIDAAAAAKVNHFIMVSSLGTNKFGFPAALLNLFWGVLIWKRKAEEALIASGLPYTIVRPGGMERPTDAFKETHNMTVSEEDTLFGGLVSNLQVAELIAFMARNHKLSYCKVVEVIAETTAPLKPMDELLAKIPPQCDVPKELDVADEPEPAPVENVASEAPSTPAQEEPELEKVLVARPLSPYTAYENLKPPTSPIPTAPGSQREKVSPPDAVVKIDGSESQTSPSLETKTGKMGRPLSPYVVYEDLKPPSSPSPTPDGSKQAAPKIASELEVPAETGGNDVATTSTSSSGTDENTPLGLASGNSPYQAYEDLKPPTSPSPSAPGVSFLSYASGNSNSTPPTAPVEHKQDNKEVKQRPLSPYTMYEDLKPPTTPSPSPRKFN